MARFLIVTGILCLVAGLVWPWLSKLGLGHLPGDIHFERRGFSFHFPLMSSVVISLAISVLIWLFRR